MRTWPTKRTYKSVRNMFSKELCNFSSQFLPHLHPKLKFISCNILQRVNIITLWGRSPIEGRNTTTRRRRVKFWGAENSASALWDFQDAADAPPVVYNLCILKSGIWRGSHLVERVPMHFPKKTASSWCCTSAWLWKSSVTYSARIHSTIE